MLRKRLAIAAAAGVALAAPSSALAMHGPGEKAPRLPRNLESHGSVAQTVFVTSPVANGSFSWFAAGIGASVTGACALALVGGRRVIVQRRLHQAS